MTALGGGARISSAMEGPSLWEEADRRPGFCEHPVGEEVASLAAGLYYGPIVPVWPTKYKDCCNNSGCSNMGAPTKISVRQADKASAPLETIYPGGVAAYDFGFLLLRAAHQNLFDDLLGPGEGRLWMGIIRAPQQLVYTYDVTVSYA